MELQFHPISTSQVFAISVWRYEPPYELYNLDYPPTSDDVAYWQDPINNVNAMLNNRNELVGFCSFGPDGQVPGGDYSGSALDIGMGIRPDLTGMGNGIHFAQAVCAYALESFEERALRVTVASQNTRAKRVWSAYGFQSTLKFVADKTDKSFVLMEKKF